MNWKINRLNPLGAEVYAAEAGEDLRPASAEAVRDLVLANRVAVFRGFAPMIGDDFPVFCSAFGEVLEFDFGVVNELKPSANAKNYLYTNNEVPFHWDGAFIGRVPSFIFFHCDKAPPARTGGETLFADTTLVLRSAPAELAAEWADMEITYSTQKIVHYGGTFSSPVLAKHPKTGEQVIRFAEPVSNLNPVTVAVKGLAAGREASFLADMHARLNAPDVCYGHHWREGDLLIADNHALLHGRRAFDQDADRRIRRVNVL